METKRSQFRIRFEEHLGNGGYTKFCLPDQETYQTIINLLSGTVSENTEVCITCEKKFEILEVGGLQKIIKLRKNPDDGIQYLLPKSEIFDALWDAHLSTGHGGEKKMRFFIADMYDNVTQKMIAAFVSNCETCQKKKTKPNKGLVVRQPQTKNILERGQVDLIVMESAPDREFKYILNYQDHFSKFLFLRPMD